MDGLLKKKLPISLLVSNGGILIGLLFGAFQFYQQFESNTQAIEQLTEQMGQVEEQITASDTLTTDSIRRSVISGSGWTMPSLHWAIDWMRSAVTQRRTLRGFVPRPAM